jgi:hypothetical protein
MSHITATFVQNIYVMYIKDTSGLYNLDLTPNKIEQNCRGPNVARNITAFCSLVMFLVDGLDSTDW